LTRHLCAEDVRIGARKRLALQLFWANR